MRYAPIWVLYVEFSNVMAKWPFVKRENTMNELSQALTMVKNISAPLQKDPKDADALISQGGPLFKQLDNLRQRYGAHYGNNPLTRKFIKYNGP